MNKIIKWGGIALGLFLVLIAGAVVLVPMLVDVQKYKPQIEALVTEQTGRSFSMGGDIQLSVFPWVGVSLSDLTLGNAKGFDGKEMVSVKAFKVRLKVIPLLSRRVEVDSFVMDSPRISLVKNKNGRGNWEMKPAAAKKEKAEAPAGDGSLPIDSLTVGRFAVINGFLSFADRAAGTTREVSDLNLELTDVSLDRPVTLDFSAKIDGQPLSLTGTAGPIGKQPGQSDMDLDLAIQALKELDLKLKGRVMAPVSAAKLDLSVDLAPFSPRKVFDRLGREFPVETSDPKVLDRVSLKARILGSAQAVSVSEGSLGLDDATLTFTAQAKDFNKPDLRFDLSLDQIDVDRYLPPAGKTDKETAGKAPGRAGAKTDYGPLRKMVLDGKARIDSLKAANLKMDNVLVHVTGKNGIFNLDPFSMDLYQGNAGVTGTVDVRNKVPKTDLAVKINGVQAGPMIKDAVDKEMIQGTLAADMALSMTGDAPDQIKKSLGGKGNLTFTDGAIVGIDIAGTIRNAKSGLGLGSAPKEKPRTDFAELKIPYTADGGRVKISGASLVSPLLRLTAHGQTHLVEESLDFRIEPKLVATLKGQGDTKDRSGLLIPLLVSGTYASPKIRPDLKAMVGGQVPDVEDLKKMIQGSGKEGSTDAAPKEAAKKLLKGLFN